VSGFGLEALARGILYAAGLALAIFGMQLFVRQRWLVFRPSSQMLPVSYGLAKAVEAVTLETPAGTLRGWWVRRPNGGPAQRGGAPRTVYLLPGAVGNISHDAESIAFLFSMGASVLAIDYPGYGESTGRPSEKSFNMAADAGWNYLTTRLAARPEQTLLVGRSLGSVLALGLAARQQVRGLVIHGAFTSLPDVAAAHYPFLPARILCFIRFPAQAAARSLRCPVLFVHGRDDRVVPLSLGRRCYDVVSTPKQLIVVPGGHGGASWTLDPAVRQAMEGLWSGQVQGWA
jgi:hypothetical protein